jgi:preprotein translocase subunit SecG
MGFTVFLVLITIVCLLLIIVIMVQNPKGGGLSSTFGSSQQMGGVQKTTDFLDKSTWTLGILLIGLILLSGLSFEGETTSRIMTGDSSAPVSAPAPATTPAPAATEQPATQE